MRVRQDLDPKCEGIYQTYQRKLQQIEHRYDGMEPKAILKRLLGADTLRDDEAVASSSSTASPVTGEQGGRLLMCYLYWLEQEGKGPSAGTQGWLEAQQPRFQIFPAQKLCIEQALKFLPKLTAGLAAHAADDGPPEPVFDSDDDFSF